MNRADRHIRFEGKPGIERAYGDHPVLDILKIAYNDYTWIRFTKVEKLLKLMYEAYPGYSRNYLKKMVNVTITSHWFRKVNDQEVHINERGVEIYLTMMQNYWSEKWAQDNNLKAKWNIFLVIVGILLTTLVIYLDLR